MEQERIQTRLMKLGVHIIPLRNLASINADHVELTCIYTEATKVVPSNTVVLATMREPRDGLFRELQQASDNPSTKFKHIGDCLAPGTIAAAIYSGHRYARELGEPAPDGVPFRRELPALAAD